MAKDKLGVGVFGMGWVSTEHIKGYMRNPRCEIKALASRRKESAEARKSEFNLDCAVVGSFDEEMI
mgnify:FL=1